MAIVAAVAAPGLMSNTNTRVYHAAHDLAIHIKLARDLAVATQCHTWVDFDTALETYSVYIEDPDNPGRGNRVYATHPADGGDFTVQLDSGSYAGVTIQSASFGGRAEVEFDWSGTPYNGLAAALTSDGTVVLAGGGQTRTVRVVAETGYVQED